MDRADGGVEHPSTARELLPLALLAAAIALFTYGWSVYAWNEYLSLHLPVFDFGVNYQVIWAAAHGTQIDFFGVGTGSLILYLLLPAFYLIPSESAFFLFLMVFQALWLALGAVPLYLVARDQLRRRWAALGLALAYLAFPAFAGPVWYPFHFEALFPTLFLFGYWQYRRNALLGAAGFWTACLFTQAGDVVVMGFFAFGSLVEPRLSGGFRRLRAFVGKQRTSRGTPAAARTPGDDRGWSARSVLPLYLFVASLLVFVVVASAYGWIWFLHYVTKSGPSATGLSSPFYSAPAASNLPLQGWTMFLLFGPLLALPLLGREERWGLVPYLAMLLLTSQHGFWFPFRNQYPALLVGPLFAATLRGVERVDGWARARAEQTSSDAPRHHPRWVRFGRPEVTCTGVLVAVLVTAVFIAPWGPLNPALRGNSFLAPGYYNDSADFGTNLTLDAQIRALADSVPSPGVVLTQTELVEPLDREYYMIPSRYDTSVPLNYVLTDPYNPSFYGHTLDGPFNTTMEQWANYFLAQGWGVRGEVDGALLLAGNFTGPPVQYTPIDQWFPGSTFPCCGNVGTPWNGSTHGPWTYGPDTPFDGNYNVFSPGRFNLTVVLHVDHPRATDRIQCQVTGDKGADVLWSGPISGAAWTTANGTVAYTMPLDVPAYELTPRVLLHVAAWTGGLTLVGVQLLQVGPPVTLGTG